MWTRSQLDGSLLRSQGILGVDDTLKRVVDEWLGASFDTSDPVSERVQASFGGVHLDDALKGNFATLKFLLPVLARLLALLDKEGLGVLTVKEHLPNVVRLSNMWFKSVLTNDPTRRKPAGNSSSHLFIV